MFDDKKLEQDVEQIKRAVESMDCTLKALLNLLFAVYRREQLGIFFINPTTGRVINMSLKIPAGQVVQGFATLQVNGVAVGTIPNDASGNPQALAVVSADPLSFSVAMDNPPVQAPNDANGNLVLTIGSFKITALNPPAQPDVPVGITETLTNGDGTVGATLADTVEVDSDPTGEILGDLFDAPVAPVPPASQARQVSSEAI